MSSEKGELTKRLLECLEESRELKDDLDSYGSWSNSLKELSEIERAFEVDERNRLHGKTILDVGTDCVKPLYIALKYEPSKIIGINDNLPPFALDVEKNVGYFTANTEINFHEYSLFDRERIKEILGTERFHYVLVSKTLHHLRNGKDCVANRRDKNHLCEEEGKKNCINSFAAKEIFKDLIGLGDRVIIYEYFDDTPDDDKERGRGGYFTAEELEMIFKCLISEKYTVEFLKPRSCSLDKKELKRISVELEEVNDICFYVEKQRDQTPKSARRR